MGTKLKVKTRQDETEGSQKKEKKTKKIFLFRMVRKRKRLSQSQECLHDTGAENFKTHLEVDEQEKEHINDVDMDAAKLVERSDEMHDEILNDFASLDGTDHADDAKVTDKKHKPADEKKRLFSSPIKFLKNSFSTKKRRKQKEYSKFWESMDNILADSHDTELKPDDDRVDETRDNMKQSKKTNSKRYVRFETGDDDDDKENMAMTIDDKEDVVNNQPQSSSTPKEKKKKKSAKKKVAKAGRKTGRVFKVGMIQMGRNLQYLTPIPTPHTFADPSKKKADYTDKPKKRTYKYTASAPPANPYGFV